MLLLSGVLPLRAAVRSPSGALLPRQVHVSSQGSEKWAFQVERQFSLQSTDNFRYHCGKKKKKVPQEAPVCSELEQDTPVYCACLMCVHNAFLIEIWLGYTSNHFTIPGSYMTHGCSGGCSQKSVCSHTKLLTFQDYVANNTNTEIQHCYYLKCN